MKGSKREHTDNTFIALVDIFNTWLQYVGILILCIMTITVFVAVLSRFFIGFSLSWVEESATFAMAWICAIGAGLTARKGGLTTIEIGVMWLPEHIKRVVAVIAALISFCIFTVIIYYGTEMAIIVNSQHATTIPMLTMFWVYVAMPFGVLIMFVNTLIHTVEVVRGGAAK
ncbi:TRAP transporter small permease [Sphaerochaeta globosa]|uniref:Tripartite ATP-independent periplasmic transporter DctQ component n=1 Tax=Sphaerochaeta globosa (strain ATCC BAA-1886 / DSM 22777 / Buddy) TaxID=158189 RepID=F0RT35_SPHGB|nr:TRAP transporter small permease [Sphaerochaeta globosa]ADY14481.1 Tripartite ATP-independent periplasmic transporter DctQ component [Sphaerochaeta globosa str. Buddy]